MAILPLSSLYFIIAPAPLGTTVLATHLYAPRFQQLSKGFRGDAIDTLEQIPTEPAVKAHRDLSWVTKALFIAENFVIRQFHLVSGEPPVASATAVEGRSRMPPSPYPPPSPPLIPHNRYAYISYTSDPNIPTPSHCFSVTHGLRHSSRSNASLMG